MQGDAYGLTIEILNDKGEVVTDENVSEVEVMIGSLRKTYADNEITFSDDKWTVHLSQNETFQLQAAHVKAQVRVKWSSGNVEGADLGLINVRESLSKEVL